MSIFTSSLRTLTQFAILALCFTGSRAMAFPDLIRHNYVNCNSCHVSPTGGGALTPYGRALSNEVLSRWGTEKETLPLHGLIPEEKLPEWLIVGGDVRYAQVHRESPERRTGRSFVMQTALELGARIGRVVSVLSIGEPIRETREIRPNASRYYVMYNLSDELSLRAGRFIPVFGINMAYHTLPTRQGLGLAPGLERDAIEGVWSGEKWSAGVSVSRAQAAKASTDQRESLATLQLNRSFADSHRMGVSFLAGQTKKGRREGIGVHGLFGFNEQWAYLSEFTLQMTSAAQGSTKTGLYHFSQLLWEPTKGINIYLLEEYEKADLSDSRTLVSSFGPGLRFFPRPHFELDFAFLKKRTVSVADRYDDYAWLVLHYYF